MDTGDRDPCQELTPAKRNSYFSGQLLTEDDFREEQEYFRGKGKRHNRYLHGYGVVCGLRVVPAGPSQPMCVVVEPGLALDAWGREIVVPEPVEFDLGERGCRGALGITGRTESPFLVVEYRESPADFVPVLPGPAQPGSQEESAASRILEAFELGLRREPPEVGDRVDLELCELLADGIRQGAGVERLHRLLCEIVSQPCRPCEPDPGVTLARIDLPARGAVTDAQIDNCSHRHLALSADRLLQVLLCTLGSLGR
jgi:hypothetical protein